MIAGIVSPDREALITLLVIGPEGNALEVEFAIDTGFTEDLMLPRPVIGALRLSQIGSDEIMLADGSRSWVSLHPAAVLWMGVQRPVTVQEGEGTPLLGMGLLLDHLLTLPVRVGDAFTITPIS
jgi:clan AA aspartic protease